ncbi:hypothetical protein PR048_002497 [Dryococelus australis]|uniref:Uncharacterized protein n=1 Tax=Dryococelus australis TaxID=614101 RepID=A0ABQ9IKC8_9NEOP|nr:hypothetical protein PR048_002497 [Dryococelus australis]
MRESRPTTDAADFSSPPVLPGTSSGNAELPVRDVFTAAPDTEHAEQPVFAATPTIANRTCRAGRGGLSSGRNGASMDDELSGGGLRLAHPFPQTTRRIDDLGNCPSQDEGRGDNLRAPPAEAGAAVLNRYTTPLDLLGRFPSFLRTSSVDSSLLCRHGRIVACLSGHTREVLGARLTWRCSRPLAPEPQELGWAGLPPEPRSALLSALVNEGKPPSVEQRHRLLRSQNEIELELHVNFNVQVMPSVPPATSMGTVSTDDYNETVNDKDALSTDEYTTPATKKSRLDFEDKAGSEAYHKDSIDDDCDDSDSVEDDDDSLDVSTHFANEFPSTSDAKKAEDAGYTDYYFPKTRIKLWLVYETPVDSIMSLIARIHAAAADVQDPQNVITATEDSMFSRCRLCIREGGHQLYQFLELRDQLLHGINCKRGCESDHLVYIVVHSPSRALSSELGQQRGLSVTSRVSERVLSQRIETRYRESEIVQSYSGSERKAQMEKELFVHSRSARLKSREGSFNQPQQVALAIFGTFETFTYTGNVLMPSHVAENGFSRLLSLKIYEPDSCKTMVEEFTGVCYSFASNNVIIESPVQIPQFQRYDGNTALPRKRDIFTNQEEVQCVSGTMRTQPPITAQRNLQTTYEEMLSDLKSIKSWYGKFKNTGSVADLPGTGRPSTSAERVQSARKKSRHLQIR